MSETYRPAAYDPAVAAGWVSILGRQELAHEPECGHVRGNSSALLAHAGAAVAYCCRTRYDEASRS